MCFRFVLTVLGLFGFTLLLPCNTGRAGGEEKDDAERVKEVRAFYKQTPATILGFREPIKVAAIITADGKVPKYKSISFQFDDADGKRHSFDWYFEVVDLGHRGDDRIYIYPPKKQKLHCVPVRGPEEAALYGLLLRWSPTTDIEKKGIGKGVDQLLAKFDKRFGEKPVPAKDFSTLEDGIKTQRARIEQAEREISDARKKMDALQKELEKRNPKE
jgi:hypothetical protein